MLEIRDLKCKCCKCYDSFDGCTAFDCEIDFQFSMEKAINIAREYGVSFDSIIAILGSELQKNGHRSLECSSNEYGDEQFMVIVSGVDEPTSLCDMKTSDLQLLKQDIDRILQERGI